ncbi:MAG: SpoIIIAH-like family protein [Lachnospiraceae bacterium]|nr:SpoIIIAH-like family protein [Lachnospiraceae bacterium]
MKKIMKKNQIIITALAIMIVVAGYLNFTGQEISTSGLVSSRLTKQTEEKEEKKEETETKKTNDASEAGDSEEISEEDLTSADYTVNDQGEIIASEENPGEAVMVSNQLSSDYFSSAKLSREQNRAKNKETLMEIINNKEIASKDKKKAVAEVAELTKTSEQENAAELMLEAKGFTEAVVSISDGSADVVVNVSELTEKEMAQIEDIIKRKTDVSPENIVITPVKVEKKK